jgi:hypothetical protein
MYEGVLSGLSEFDSLHSELRNKIKTLYPLSDIPLTTADAPSHSQDFLLQEILNQLKEIQKELKKG